nr:MAG TPA: hypothetical protein [Caudoviricetes sp.]
MIQAQLLDFALFFCLFCGSCISLYLSFVVRSLSLTAA